MSMIVAVLCGRWLMDRIGFGNSCSKVQCKFYHNVMPQLHSTQSTHITQSTHTPHNTLTYHTIDNIPHIPHTHTHTTHTSAYNLPFSIQVFVESESNKRQIPTAKLHLLSATAAWSILGQKFRLLRFKVLEVGCVRGVVHHRDERGRHWAKWR